LYNIFIEFVISVKLVRLIKILVYWNESYSRVLVCTDLSDMISVTNG
jgi:hypothetical protein